METEVKPGLKCPEAQRGLDLSPVVCDFKLKGEHYAVKVADFGVEDIKLSARLVRFYIN